jgi:hypothetical protein
MALSFMTGKKSMDKKNTPQKAKKSIKKSFFL